MNMQMYVNEHERRTGLDGSDPLYKKMNENPVKYYTLLTGPTFLEGVVSNVEKYPIKELYKLFNWLIVVHKESLTRKNFETTSNIQRTKDVVEAQIDKDLFGEDSKIRVD